MNQNEYAYDGLNQRVWTNKLPSPTASNPNPSTAVKTYEIYSSNGQLLTEYTPSQGKVDEHIYLGTKRIGLASRRWGPAPTQTYFHLDPAATPLLATTTAGTVAWKENHRPYGDKLNNLANASNNTIGYAGKPYDNATGLSYMGARYYHPTLGRFTGIDPVGFTEANLHSHNRYTYANNNPYKFVDPDGREAADVASVLGDVVGQQFSELGKAIDSKIDSGIKGVEPFATKAVEFALMALSRGRPSVPNTGITGLTHGKVGLGVTNPSMSKMSPQTVPEGMSKAQFGEMVGWGRGSTSVATANKSAENLTADAVKGMQTKGLTPEMAKGWRDGYAQDFSRNANNFVAEARSNLMGKIADFMK